MRDSDLLVECNNARMPQRLLEAYIALYPHARRRLLRTTFNHGYRCAQICALAWHMRQESDWWSYGDVVSGSNPIKPMPAHASAATGNHCYTRSVDERQAPARVPE